MVKQAVRAKDVLRDLRDGATDAELMEKYRLSEKGLRSLFRKMMEGGVVSVSYLRARAAAAAKSEPASQAVEPSEPEATPVAASPADAPAGDATDAETAKAIAADMKAGKHPTEIMQRYELSPLQLERVVKRLREEGLLNRDDQRRGKPKPTAQCPHCGSEVPEGAPRCGNCGEMTGAEPRTAPAEPPSPGPRPRPTPIAAQEEIKECPWEESENYGVARAFFLTAKKILVTPSHFFSDLPLEGGFIKPITFGIVSAVVGVAITMLAVSLFKSGSGFGLFGIVCGMVGALAGASIAVPIVLLVWSLLAHGALVVLQGADKGFEATFRVVAYSSVTQVFNVIPFVGALASLVYGLVLMVIGFKETHDASTGKAVVAALITPALGAILAAVIAAAMVGMMAGAMPH
jgi:Mor family transcriptional regulator